MSLSSRACNLAPWRFSGSTLRSVIPALPRSLGLQACQLPCRRQYQHRPKENDAKYTSASNTERFLSGTAFIGREDDLTRLWTSLRPQPSPSRRVAVVHGPDGVGKSRLVAHFSRLYEKDFSSIWWVDGKDKNSVLASLGALASRLPTNKVASDPAKAPNSGLALERQATMALEWLSKKNNSKWLLIFDDVAAYQSAGTPSSDAYNIRDFFPWSDHGSILVTTTDPDMAEVGESHALRKLNPQESLEFFDTGTEGRADNGQAGHIEARKLLVRELEGLPLAVTLAACYIRQTDQNISRYLQLFQGIRQHPQYLRATTEHKCDSTMLTCALSFNAIQQSNPFLAKFLTLLSCYNNTRIHSAMLEYGRGNPALLEWFANSPSLEGGFVNDFRTLCDFSLITALDNAGTYSMHPVVKKWCRDNINPRQQEELNTIALISVGTAAARALDEGSPRDRQLLLPHADEMRRILRDGGLVSSSEQTIPAIKSLGSLYEDQGRLSHAEGMYLDSLSRSQVLFGHSHCSTRQIVRDLRRLRFTQWQPWSFWWDLVTLGIFELLAGLAMFTFVLLSLSLNLGKEERRTRPTERRWKWQGFGCIG